MNTAFFSSVVVSWLTFCAQIALRKVQPEIIGVTGSSGKSSCVHAIDVVLSQLTTKKVKVGKKGNSETGIPMEILGIPVDTYTGLQWLGVCVQAIQKALLYTQKYDILVLEMGIDSESSPKNMSHLLSFIHPHIGVLLSISAVHGQNFSGNDILQSIANEKGKLLTSIPQSGTAIYSVDYPQVLSFLPKIKSQQLTFSSQQQPSDFCLIEHSVSFEGTEFLFQHHDKQHSLFLPKSLHFKESFGTFASAILVGIEHGLSIENSIDRLSKQFQLPPGRMNIIDGINECTLIDSSYNSSVVPTTAALRMLMQLPGRKIAILGDMRELGKQAQSDHEQLAAQAAQSADLIVLIGPLTKQFAVPYLTQHQFPSERLLHFKNAYQAIESLQQLVHKGDVVLIKGSQNTIFLEIIVKALMKHPELAKKLLCRQTPYWEKQRQKILAQTR